MKTAWNLAANYLGSGWGMLLTLLFVPKYIEYLGLESFGLIGLHATLASLLALLNFGMAPTLGRVMARFTSGARTGAAARQLLVITERLFVVMGLVIALAIWGLSGPIATRWLNVESLPADLVTRAIALMGVLVAAGFLQAIYMGALAGLQRQVWLNVAGVIFGTIGSAGVLGALHYIAPTIEVFLAFQIVNTLAFLITMRLALARWVPNKGAAEQSASDALRSVWKFAGGVTVVNVLGTLMVHADRLLLSKMLSLEAFGTYALATSPTRVIGRLATPISQAFFPRLTELVALGNETDVRQCYHLTSQITSVAVGSAGVALALFADRAMLLWTGDQSLSVAVTPIVRLLALGTMFANLLQPAYTLQLAYGWLTLAIRMGTLTVLVYLPLVVFVVREHGMLGAAWLWFGLNATFILLNIQLMHRRLLRGAQWHWYVHDVAKPLAAEALVALALWTVYPMSLPRFVEAAMLGLCGILMISAATFASRELRATIAGKIRRRRSE